MDVRDFQADVVEASRELPVLVDFWAEWCGPCRILGPVLERLAAENEGRWRLAKVDTEAFPHEAARYGIRSIPNVKLFVDGEPVDEFTGALPETQVRRWLERALPTEEDRQARRAVEEARSLLFTDPRAALDLLKAVAVGPDEGETVADLELLARLLLEPEDRDEELTTEAGRLYLEAIGRLRAQEFDDALGGFIDALRKERTLDGEAPRRACLALFRLLGHDHPVVRRRRADLASALYA